jgi:hypothetical protein
MIDDTLDSWLPWAGFNSVRLDYQRLSFSWYQPETYSRSRRNAFQDRLRENARELDLGSRFWYKTRILY